jgi:hypothetical protein
MKNTAKPPLYFFANPLKLVQTEPAASSGDDYQTPYLRSVLSAKSTPSKVYSLKSIRDILIQSIRPFTSTLPKDIELIEKDWFNNYE